MTRLWLLVCLVVTFCNCIPVDAKPTHVSLTAKQQTEAILRVKHDWHASTGESAEQIIASAAKIAHFIPRRWDADRMDDGRIAVNMAWAEHKQDKSVDEHSMSWVIASDGSIEVTSSYAKTMVLGSAAFNVSLLQNEVTTEVAEVNTGYLRDPLNYNFINTPNGKLGDLLSSGGCKIQDPSYIFYEPDINEQKQDKAFFLKLIVNCNGNGPSYFMNDGYIAVKLNEGSAEWQPLSFFAQRIWDRPPPDWFKDQRTVERDVRSTVTKTLEPFTSLNLDEDDVLKFIETRNSGSMSGPLFNKERVAKNVLLLTSFYIGTDPQVSPHSMLMFNILFGAIPLNMSDYDILSSAAYLSALAVKPLSAQ